MTSLVISPIELLVSLGGIGVWAAALIWAFRGSARPGLEALVILLLLLATSAWLCMSFEVRDCNLQEHEAAAKRAEAADVSKQAETEAAVRLHIAEKEQQAERTRKEPQWLARYETMEVLPGRSKYVTYNVGPARVLMIEAVEVMGKAISVEVRQDGEIISSTKGAGRKVTVETQPLVGVITVKISNEDATGVADIRFSVLSRPM